MCSKDQLPRDITGIGDNVLYLHRLEKQLSHGTGVVPFVGAGMSSPFGFPLWRKFLLMLAAGEGLEREIAALLNRGQFEEAAGTLQRRMKKRFDHWFNHTFGDRVLEDSQISGAVRVLPRIAVGPVITTNFDHVLERAFDAEDCGFSTIVWGKKIKNSFVPGFHRNERWLLKIHGDVNDPEDRILTYEEYVEYYGFTSPTEFDRSKMLPTMLASMMTARPMLFVGCSLDKDRTVSVLKDVSRDIPNIEHYAILEQPGDSSDFSAKRKELAEGPIAPIWFSPGRYDQIETILRYLAGVIPEAIRPGAPKGKDRSPRASLEALPTHESTFVGRVADVAAIVEVLKENRLVTLHGVGGCGKTRLALRVARALESKFADGVAFVQFAALRDPEAVPQKIAKSLGLQEQAKRPPTDALSEFLVSKHMLLVLDNCEHLVEACADVVRELMTRSKNLTCLVTSRQVLELPGEKRWRVTPLGMPSPNETPDLERLAQYDAVALFIERASALRHEFALTEDNAGDLLVLCRRLDGIPLAIELAAARITVMTVQDLVEGLDEMFRILTKGRPGALPQHQTLEAAIQWSYDLLSQTQSELLQILSVFRSGGTAEAVRHIGFSDGLDEFAVLDRLDELVGRSLVVAEPRQGEIRFHLLEVVRQFAAARLVDAEQSQACRDRHLDWYLGWSERGSSHLTGADEALWLETFELEHDNLRAALDWAIKSERRESALRLGTAARRFWEKRGYLNEGRRQLDRLLTATARHAPDEHFSRALSAAGLIAYRQGDSTAALQLMQRALEQERQLSNKVRLAEAISDLGIVTQVRGDFGLALELHGQSYELNRELKDRRQATVALYNMGNTAYETGDLDRARKLLREAADEFTSAGNTGGSAFALTALGMALISGNSREAEKPLQEAKRLRREKNDKRGVADSLNGLGRLALAEERLYDAEEYLAESLRLRREVGDQKGIALSLESFALLASAAGYAERTAVLMAAVDELRAELVIPRRPVDQPFLLPALAQARGALSRESFDDAQTKGAAMSVAESIGYALE